MDSQKPTSDNSNVKFKQIARKSLKKPSESMHLEDMSPFTKIYAGVPLALEEKKSETKSQLMPQIERPAYLSNDQIIEIRQEVEEAIKQRKIFYMCGHYRSIKRALLQRGWIEKMQVKSPIKMLGQNNQNNFVSEPSSGIDTEQDYTDDILQHLPEQQSGETLDQHLKKCTMEIKARMLQSHPANFYWNIRKESLSWLHSIPRDALINRFPRVRFTSKEGLCAILQQMHWYTEPGVANTSFPRCYNLTYPDQFLSFVDDFRITSCMSLLKSFLYLVSNEGEIAVRSLAGNLPISVIYFAIDRCLEYISVAEHIDIDCEMKKVWDHEWENFFTNVDLFMNHKKRFLHKSGEETIQQIKEKVTQALKKMVKYWPQYNLDGNRNIWIVKPGNRCRGQGIILMDKFQSILALVLNCNPKKHRYVIQKYVERPLLIHDTKFDIRQWFLLTSAQPLILWMYTECYLRFSSQLFSLQDFHESIHLTNNAVQKKYRTQLSDHRSKELPDENMWDCHTFKAYLKRIGQYDKWESQIYPGMKEAIVGAMLASQESMDRKGNYFELYGADFILGQDLVPWLLEINSSPDMSSSTSVTSRMCPQCLEDVIKVVVDRRDNPLAATGLFECAYKQQCPRPPTYLGLQLTVRGRRMLRHKYNKLHAKTKSVESINICNGDLENLLKMNDYQGPIIGDFIEDLQHKPLIKPSSAKRASRRKRRTNSLRSQKRTVHQHFQPTINTITMKPKSLIQTPLSFSFCEKFDQKRPILTQNSQNLTLKLDGAEDNNKLTENSTKSIKINRNYTAIYRSTASELWKSKISQNNFRKSLSSKCKLNSRTSFISSSNTNNSNNNNELDKNKSVKIPENNKTACPRLVRSMYDPPIRSSGMPKSILHNFLTVGFQYIHESDNKIALPLNVNETISNNDSIVKT